MRRPTALLATTALTPVPLLGTSGGASAHPGHGPVPGEGQLARSAAHPDVDAVRLRVEGMPVTTLWGHVDWCSPARLDSRPIAD